MTFPVYPIPEERAIRDQLADLSYAQRQILEPVRDAISSALDTTHSGQEKLLGTLSRRALTQATRLRHEQRAALAPLARDAELQAAIAHDEQRRLAGNLPPLPREDLRGVSLAVAHGRASFASVDPSQADEYRAYLLAEDTRTGGTSYCSADPGQRGPANFIDVYRFETARQRLEFYSQIRPQPSIVYCSLIPGGLAGEPQIIEAPVPPIGGLEGAGAEPPGPPVGGQIEQRPAQPCPPCDPGTTEQRQRYKLCQHDTRKTDCRIINAEECCPRDYAEKAESDDRQTLQMLLECLCKRAMAEEEIPAPQPTESPEVPGGIGGLEGLTYRPLPANLCDRPLLFPVPEPLTEAAGIGNGFAIPQP